MASTPTRAATRERATRLDGLSATGRGAQLAAVRERLIFKDADGAHERGALLALARPQLAVLRPARELAVHGELQRLHLLAREAMRRLVHDGSS